ncbi:hypothetical protein ACFE04_012607 [Oxalis oulophora]
MMHMTFYWGTEATILFSTWHTHTYLSYALSLLACFIAAVFYQYLEDRRLQLKLIGITTSAGTGGRNEEEPLLIGGGKVKKSCAARVLGAVLFGVNSGLGYMLMLAVMSFNGGVFIATVVGLAVGYFLFRSSGDELKLGSLDNPCACA